MARYPSAVGLLLSALLALVAQDRPGTKSAAPDVILITIDTLRADRLGCYGYRAIETPNIDAIARDGIRFAQAVAQCPITLPSHCSILTGTYPMYHGVRDNGGYRLPAEQLTLAEVLKQNGYRTGAFVGAYILDSKTGLNQGFDTYVDGFETSNRGETEIAIAQHRAGKVMASALGWLKKTKAGERSFAWIHLFDPHAPYDPPPPFSKKYSNDLYSGEIAYVDSVIGELIAYLKSRNLYSGTLLTIISDHGEGLGEHGEATHGLFLYDSTLRIPWILKPPVETARRAVSTPVSEGENASEPRPSGSGPSDPAMGDPLAYARIAQMASPGLVPGEPRFCTRTDRYPNNGASAGLVPAERKIFAGSGEPSMFAPAKASRQSWDHRHKAGGGGEFWTDAALVKNLGSAGTRTCEKIVASASGRHYCRGHSVEGRLEAGATNTVAWILSHVPSPAEALFAPPLIWAARPYARGSEFGYSVPVRGKYAGRVISEQVQSIDLMPTVLQFLGIPKPESVQGAGLLSVIEGKKSPETRYSLGETLLPRDQYGWSPLLSIRGEDHKFIQAPKSELFDLREDPLEKSNLYSASQALANQLRQRRESLASRYSGNRAAAARVHTQDPAAFQKFLGLGYVSVSADSSAAADTESRPDPKDKVAVFDLLWSAVSDSETKRYSEAVGKLKRVVATDPNTYFARVLLGMTYFRMGNFLLAVQELKAALSLRPEDLTSTFHLGMALARMGENKTAEHAFQKVLELDPGNDGAWNNLGIAYLNEKRLVEASEIFRKRVEANPRDSFAWANLGLAYMSQGRNTEAIQALRRALNIDPALPQIHNNLGLALMNSGQRSEAMRHYRKAISLDPGYAQAHYNLALALKQQGLEREAAKEMETAKRLFQRQNH